MTFPSKVQPAGGCFELQTLYGACRVFVLKITGYTSENWMFYRGASHLPNSLIYKKVPQIAVCEQSKSEKLGILCIFGQRNSLKFRKGSSFVRLAPSEAKT